MEEPYADILRRLQGDLSASGFHLSEDKDYQAVYQNGDWQLIFRTERYYQPSLDLWIAYNSPSGHKHEFAVWLLIEILAPKSIPKTRAGDMSPAALLNMASQQLQFLRRHREQVFAVPPPYAEQYRIRNEDSI